MSRPTIRRRKDDPRERAKELTESGMPAQMAHAVANGKLDLSEALERMARMDQVDKLIAAHGLDRALAFQVALGQADLDKVLYRRRMDDYRAANLQRTVLEVGEALVLGLHGGTSLTGTLEAVDAFTVTVAGEPVHKLQLQYVYAKADWKGAKKALRKDKSVVALGLEPQPRPQDRYGCSDKRLFRYMSGEVEVTATLLDGVTIRGKITWFSRYEVGIEVKGDAVITVFRHAFQNIGR